MTEQEINAVSDSLAQKYILITRTKAFTFLGGFFAFFVAAGTATYQSALSAISDTGANSAVEKIRKLHEEAQSKAVGISELLESFSRRPASILYAEVEKAPGTKSNQFVDIEDLSLQLPPSDSIRKFALVALNIPSPYAEGSNYPGAEFALEANGRRVAKGTFTYESRTPGSSARQPFTLIVRVKLDDVPIEVQAQWRSVRDAKCRIDSFASISAVLG